MNEKLKRLKELKGLLVDKDIDACLKLLNRNSIVEGQAD
jgi:hypothetical protein